MDLQAHVHHSRRVCCNTLWYRGLGLGMLLSCCSGYCLSRHCCARVLSVQLARSILSRHFGGCYHCCFRTLCLLRCIVRVTEANQPALEDSQTTLRWQVLHKCSISSKIVVCGCCFVTGNLTGHLQPCAQATRPVCYFATSLFRPLFSGAATATAVAAAHHRNRFITRQIALLLAAYT